LEKYNENNEHFSIIEIIVNEIGEEKQIIGYHSIYQYENDQIQLEYFLSNRSWKIISQKLNFEEQQKLKLNSLLEDINNNQNISFDQQIQFIINQFDQFFHGLRYSSFHNLIELIYFRIKSRKTKSKFVIKRRK